MVGWAKMTALAGIGTADHLRRIIRIIVLTGYIHTRFKSCNQLVNLTVIIY